MARLRRKLAVVPGARLYSGARCQDIRVGGRQSNAECTNSLLQGDSTAEVYEWAPKLLAAVQNTALYSPIVNSDQQQKGLETDLVTVDRATAVREDWASPRCSTFRDNTLYDAFGQRQVSTIYSAQQPVLT